MAYKGSFPIKPTYRYLSGADERIGDDALSEQHRELLQFRSVDEGAAQVRLFGLRKTAQSEAVFWSYVKWPAETASHGARFESLLAGCIRSSP